MIVLPAARYITVVLAIVLQSCQIYNQKEGNYIEQNDKRKTTAGYNVQLGLEYLKQGERERAKFKLLSALKADPESPEVNSALAYYFEETGQKEQAEAFYLKAISLASNRGAQLNNYGAFLCREGKYAKADSYFLKAIKDSQYLNTAGAYENAGLCAAAIPDYEKAALYFTKALELDPDRKESLYELISIEKKLGHGNTVSELMKKYPRTTYNSGENNDYNDHNG